MKGFSRLTGLPGLCVVIQSLNSCQDGNVIIASYTALNGRGYHPIFDLNKITMRIRLLFLAALLFSLSAEAQLGIYSDWDADELTPIGEDIEGEIIVAPGEPSEFDIKQELLVVNEGNTPVTVGCRRTEVDVDGTQGMTSSLCWVLCPPYIDAGSQVIRTNPFDIDFAPGHTDASFAMHIRPNENDGCSEYLIEWFNISNDEVLATLTIILDHSASECTVSLDELPKVETQLSPNPASDQVQLTISQINEPVQIQVMDVLGQVVRSEQFNPAMGDTHMMNTSALRNGIYFIAISLDEQVLQTTKLVVKH